MSVMILTCPECASRYFVDDARVGPKGRSVRCASCGHAWRAAAAVNPFDLDSPIPLSDSALASPSGSTALSTKAGSSAESDALGSDGRPSPLPGRIRAEAIEKKKTRQAVAAGAAWAVLAAGFIALILAAVLFRLDIVRLWPQTASAYAFAKMPVNPTGLALDDVQGQTNLIGGHAALSVTVSERNVETGPRPSMPLRVILLDKTGHRLISAVSAPPTRVIAAGANKAYAVNFIDPPSDLASFQVEFAFDKIPTKTASPRTNGRPFKQSAQTLVSPQPSLAPLQAHDATPLPSNSPYALPPSAIQQPSH